MQTADFDFDLPPELVAQVPAPERDASRLLVVHRDSGQVEHHSFRHFLACLLPGDVLVLNDSRVIPARLRGANAGTGGQFELLLLEENALNDWWAMLRPAKRAREGTRIILHDSGGRPSAIAGTVLEMNDEGHRRLRFDGTQSITEALHLLGEVPLPPYIRREAARVTEQDRERYQTVFAQSPGSVAAPTAGLHFTTHLLDEIRSLGVEVHFVTLHVGLGTFAPVKADLLEEHRMHEERFYLSEATAQAINRAKLVHRRVIAVGTTALRVLESLAANSGPAGSSPPCLRAGAGRTRIFIYPPYDFRIVDALLTNFHLPRSTLLMLASAFAAPNDTRGRQLILSAYTEAVRHRYRFFSYGDAMLLL
jgi:S-adenosylmethionine:tRNA ribosyltransferase-isomerase